MTVLAAIIPLFAIIVLGFAAVRTSYLTEGHIRPAADLVARIALPALIFQSVTGAPIEETLSLAYIGGYAGGSLVTFLLGLVVFVRGFGVTLPQGALIAVGMAASNSGFLGYPIALGLIGPEAGTLLAQCMIVENLLIIPLSLVLGASQGTGRGVGAFYLSVTKMLRTPLVLALVAGLVFAALGLEMPGPLQSSIDMLARMSAPMALFVVGGTLATLPIASIWDRTAVIVGGKLLLHPAAVALGLWIAGAQGPLTQGGVLFAAMPMVTIYPILAAGAGLAGLAATALFTAVVLSFATITGVVLLIGL